MSLDSIVKFPEYVDVEPITACNLECPFCFGPLTPEQENRHLNKNPTKLLPFEFWDTLFGELKKRGTIGIVISGGEPTLYRNGKHNIIDLIQSAKKKGLLVTLSSNGTFEETLKKAVIFLDWLALPIDGYSTETQFKMRGNYLDLNYIDGLVTSLKELNPDLRIKIGTVVTAWNYEEILAIGDALISKKTPIDTWKIYEYALRRKTLYLGKSDSLSISDEAFKELEKQINSINATFNITISHLSDRRGAYLFVYYDGSLVIPNVGPNYGDRVVGLLFPNDFSALDSVVSILTSEGFSSENNRNNYLSTYTK